MLWIKATKEIFEANGQVINTQRQLQDGEYILHFELLTPELETFLLAIGKESSGEVLDEEQLQALLKLEPQEEI